MLSSSIPVPPFLGFGQNLQVRYEQQIDDVHPVIRLVDDHCSAARRHCDELTMVRFKVTAIGEMNCKSAKRLVLKLLAKSVDGHGPRRIVNFDPVGLRQR